MQTLKERAQHVMRKGSIEDYENFVQEIANAPEPDPVRWLIYAGDSLRAETADRAEAASFKIEGFRVVPLYTSPPAPSVPDGLRTIPNHAQLTQILNGLDRCVAAESKREFLRVWIRDWTAHKIATAPTPVESTN